MVLTSRTVCARNDWSVSNENESTDTSGTFDVCDLALPKTSAWPAVVNLISIPSPASTVEKVAVPLSSWTACSNSSANRAKSCVTSARLRTAENSATVTEHLALSQFASYSSLASGRSYRSEERRVGKECRFRWTPYHLKKKRSTT